MFSRCNFNESGFKGFENWSLWPHEGLEFKVGAAAFSGIASNSDLGQNVRILLRSFWSSLGKWRCALYSLLGGYTLFTISF